MIYLLKYDNSILKYTAYYYLNNNIDGWNLD